MTAEHRPIRHPRQYTEAIRRSDYYLEEKSKQGESGSERRALGATALRFVADREAQSPYLDLDMQAVRMIGLLDGFVSGERAMDAIEDRMHEGERVSRAEKITHVTEIVKFNHALRELIDSNPALRTDDITKFVGMASMELFGKDENVGFILDRLGRVMVGMQHEVVAEQALWEIDGVEDVIHADADDELHGIDLKVMYKGVLTNLDIKASQRAADSARLKAMKYKMNSVIVWSGVSSSDLGGHFRADADTVAFAAGHLENTLVQTRDRFDKIALS